VAFQGTITRKFPDIAKYNFDAALDWLQNFRIQLIGSEQLAYHVPGRVHEGFALQLNWIYPAIKQELAKQADKPVYVTGHSQGGAVAAIATKALVNDGFRVAATYTFAAPRAGDVQFASAVETEVHRLEFGDDIVPHVPMRTSFPWWMTEAVEKAKVDARVKQLLDYLAKSADPSYTPVGLLTYARPDEAPHFDLTAAEDAELATMRRMHLLFAGANLANHHHMFNYLHHILGVDMNTAMNQDAAVAVAGGLATGGITGGN
jgi:triacylglycerol lipase